MSDPQGDVLTCTPPPDAPPPGCSPGNQDLKSVTVGFTSDAATFRIETYAPYTQISKGFWPQVHIWTQAPSTAPADAYTTAYLAGPSVSELSEEMDLVTDVMPTTGFPLVVRMDVTTESPTVLLYKVLYFIGDAGRFRWQVREPSVNREVMTEHRETAPLDVLPAAPADFAAPNRDGDDIADIRDVCPDQAGVPLPPVPFPIGGGIQSGNGCPLAPPLKAPDLRHPAASIAKLVDAEFKAVLADAAKRWGKLAGRRLQRRTLGTFPLPAIPGEEVTATFTALRHGRKLTVARGIRIASDRMDARLTRPGEKLLRASHRLKISMHVVYSATDQASLAAPVAVDLRSSAVFRRR